ncbi:leucyl aminopeptidase [Pacificimonas sp. WHA3]|uniref:Probable cytosol aminopeptidase n=1 Tax=Pacificimonas pallii TaxID=2827236 RepID=A0ABS6SF72_9SPHN|nr:leucyl aminopeptidase [Pacificimonas pallii]MBV7257044.1 leucyl aminopeptidase [Pacificimonas pallii]
MQIEFVSEASASAAALVVFSAKDMVLSKGAQAVDENGGGALRKAANTARFTGSEAATVDLLAVAGNDANRVLLVGMGEAGKGDAARWEKIGAALAAKLLRSGDVRAVVDMSGLSDLGLDAKEAAAHLAVGIAQRGYAFDHYFTKKPKTQKVSLEKVEIMGAADGAADLWAEWEGVVKGVAFAKDLVSEPANKVYPLSFVEKIRALEIPGLKVEVLDEAQMEEAGMHALLGVGLGSEQPSRLLIMEWDGTDGDQKTSHVFVGKGVTFDSGGISLKPGAGMEDMKWDMGGAGAVAGTMVALASRKAKARIVGICGLVENMPDGKAQRPSDVVTSMSGQTIEVINTDAEGRLVLCDAMWWAQETYKPDVLVDLATLTGAIIIGLGHEYAGAYSNDEGLAADLLKASATSGDKLWRMPLAPRYDRQIDSQIADMKNVGGKDAGSITAAQFLKRFVQDGVKWAHLDVAGMVWDTKARRLHDRGATGFGVRLLDQYVRDVLES